MTSREVVGEGYAGPSAARPFVVLAFGSTREALAAEDAVKRAGLPLMVVPLPRHRGRLCGIALRIAPGDERAVCVALESVGIQIAARDEIEDL